LVTFFLFSNFTRWCSIILQVRWKSLWCIHREFCYKSIGEKILKIRPHAKVMIKHLVAFFFWDQCSWCFVKEQFPDTSCYCEARCYTAACVTLRIL